MKKCIALAAIGALSLALVGYAGAHQIVNNYAEVHEPPAHWNPLTATDDELDYYNFPPRPDEPERLKRWQSVVANVKWVKPEFGVGPARDPRLRLIPSPSDAGAAVQAVSASEGTSFTALFPKNVGTESCVIPGGGPAPGIRVPATCETNVVSVGGNLEVSLSEHWSNWSGDAGTGDKSHTWSFSIDPQGKIINRSESGNFPPQNMR